MQKAGVKILAGTDAPAPDVFPGSGLHDELQLLVEAGLSPIEALQSATSVIAKRFSLSDRGQISEGMRADLLLVKGDPTTTISDTLSILNVWKEGIEVKLNDNVN